jgi:peptidoglycan hydrolase-like protein with peptidoglycan-binding domain
MRIRITESQYRKLFLDESTFNFDSNVTKPSVSNEKKQKDSKLVQDISNLSDEGKTFKNSKVNRKSIPYNSDVKKLQTALEFLGFPLDRFGSDGLFGSETESAVKEFQSKYGLPETGIISNEDLEKMSSELRLKGHKDDMLPKKTTNNPDEELSSKPSVPVDFKSATMKVINKFEGGYYNPKWHKSSGMGDSGETMFGLDRKHGVNEYYSPAAKKFWSIIDKNKTRNLWKHYYRGGALEPQLTELAAEIMQTPFNRNMNNFFTPEAKKIVQGDYNLTFNFIYATWNGSGWFEKFAKTINKAVKEGITDPKQLIKIAIKKRLNSGNQIITKTGRKMSEVLGVNVN